MKTLKRTLEDALKLTEAELHVVSDVYDENFDNKIFDRLCKIHRYLEKAIKIAEGKKKKNAKN